MVFGGLFWKCRKITVGEPFMAPGGEMFRYPQHFGENVLRHGSHEWLPYSIVAVSAEIVKHQFASACIFEENCEADMVYQIVKNEVKPGTRAEYAAVSREFCEAMVAFGALSAKVLLTRQMRTLL